MDYDIWLALLGAVLLIFIRAIASSAHRAVNLFEPELTLKSLERVKTGLEVLGLLCELGAHTLIHVGYWNLALVKTWVAEKLWLPVVLCLLVQICLLVFFDLVFAYYLPKRRYLQMDRESEENHSKAYQRAEKLFKRNYWMLKVADVVFSPLSALINTVARFFLKVSGFDPKMDDTQVTEQELLSLVDEGNENGVLDSEDVAFIKNAINLDELLVGDIATHRTEMDFLWADDDLKVWDEIIRKSSHRYLPICAERVDQITGVLNANVYLRMVKPTRDAVLAEAVTAPYCVPETMTADTLLSDMKKSRTYFAVVIDEYGGTRGIISLIDILSKLVGDIDEADEAEETVPEISVHKDGSATVDAAMDIDRFAEYYHVSIETTSHTVGGWITENYGDIPEKGAFLEIAPFKVRVTESDPRHVMEALIIKEETSEEK